VEVEERRRELYWSRLRAESKKSDEERRTERGRKKSKERSSVGSRQKIKAARLPEIQWSVRLDGEWQILRRWDGA
jgi:hypothetical protein